MARALAIFAALSLLAALAYALWPDGGPEGGGAEVASGTSPGSSAGRTARAARSGSAGDPEAGARPANSEDEDGEESAEPAPLEEGEIRVEVTSRGGAPLAGARVRLYLRGARDPNTNKVDWAAAGAGRTGEDGSASFRARTGRYVVVAEADRLGRASRAVMRSAGEPVTRVALALSDPKVLNGRVQAKRTHEPIPLADVTVVPAADGVEDEVEEMPPEERLTVRADARGAFRIQGLAAGSYAVTAAAAGYGEATEGVKLPRAEDVVLELAPAGVLEGYVLGADGKPAVGAEVAVAGADEPLTVPSGAGGGFSIEVPSGTYRLSARKGEEAGALAAPVVVSARATVRGLVLKMGRAGSIVGDVVRKSSGDPVPGAQVDISPYLAAGDSGRAVTGADGRFAVGGLAPGSYDVVVRGRGLSEHLARGITIANGDVYTMHLEVSGTATIEGTVTDGSGQPLRGAVVTEMSLLADGAGASASTDEEGRYTLAGVGVGEVTLTATRAGGGYVARAELELSEDEVANHDFVLPDTSVLEGRVVAKAGGAPRIPVGVRLFQVSKRRAQLVDVDEDGTFRAEVPPDEYRVFAYDESGTRRGQIASQSVQVEPGKTSHVELAIDDSEARGGFSALVLEPGGMPSPGAQIWVMRAGRPFHGGRTDEAGRANLGPISGDGLTIRAWNGGRSGELPIPAGASEITVPLKAAGAIHGRVTGGGAAVAGFSLEADAADYRPDSFAALSFPGDEFLVTDLPADRMVLKVLTRDGRKGTATVTLTPGATAEVTVPLNAAAPVRARVVDGAGRPVPGVAVSSVEDDRHLGRTGQDGRITILSLGTPGSYLLRFEADGYGGVDLPVELKPGHGVELGDVVLPGG